MASAGGDKTTERMCNGAHRFNRVPIDPFTRKNNRKATQTMRFNKLAFIGICLFCLYATAHAKSITIALLPIPDTLPFYVAQSLGYFEEAGLTVTALPVASALERDQLMQAGRIHGMINEMAGTASFNRQTVRMRIVQTARRPMGDSPLFRILVRPGSDKRTLTDLADTPIGVSRHTIIDYLTERMLTDAGLAPEQIVTRSSPSIPERFQLLMQGRLEAAVLPDPLAFSAIQAGAREIANDLQAPFYSSSVLSFDARVVTGEKETVQAFLKAWNRAVGDINENPEAFRDIFTENIHMPPQAGSTFPVPSFPVAEIPTRAQWDDMMAWMVTRRILPSPLPYEDHVLLPETEAPRP